MSKKPETIFKERILPQLRALPKTYVMKTQEVSKRGILDVVMCVNGIFVALELKKDMKEDPDPLQRWNMQSIGAAGGIAILAYPENWETVFEIVSEIAHRGDVPDQRVMYN